METIKLKLAGLLKRVSEIWHWVYCIHNVYCSWCHKKICKGRHMDCMMLEYDMRSQTGDLNGMTKAEFKTYWDSILASAVQGTIESKPIPTQSGS